MPRGRILRPALSLPALILLFGFQATAQSRAPCSPSYTNSDEFKEMIGKKVFPKIIVDDVQIVGATQIPVSIIQDVIAKARGRELDGGEDWLNEIQDSSVRDAWQDRGFFKVLTTAETILLFGDVSIQHYTVIIHVEEGEQYRLGTVRFRSTPDQLTKRGARVSLMNDQPGAGEASNGLVFPEEQLRALVPLNEGDIFSAAKIREALDNLKSLYGSHGYVDFVATPLTDIDDSNQTISLIFELDQEQQYRIGKIIVMGPTPAQERALIWPFQSGEIFDSSKFERFFVENKSILPEGASPVNSEVIRDVKDGIVTFRFHFHPCPPALN